ncbi:MAG: type II toxin-antitoxin system antitoxin SocA domain-containing protein [Phycisphaerales bacterium JB063]
MPNPYPFNDRRYDLVLSYVLSKTDLTLDVFGMVKLHAMVDALHVIETGRPMIGGQFEAWKDGPVARPAYARANRILEELESADLFHVLKMAGPHPLVSLNAAHQIDLDEFSRSELEAMNQAAKFFVEHEDFGSRYDFFHDPNQFMGFAWTMARKEDRPLSWLEVIEAYERQFRKQQPVAKLAVSAMNDNGE